MPDRSDTARLDSIEQDGKKTRGYDSSLRRAQAAQTHDAVLEAGRGLFLERGYARTTMRDIATAAGVAVDSVYGHFRSKAALLTELMDRAHGDADDVAVADREWVREVRTRADVGEQLDALAANLTEVYATLAPLRLAVERAADADATAARIRDARRAERLAGLDRYARRLVDAGAVAGLDGDEVRDLLYAMTSPELYGVLVVERGWEPARYARWLAGTLRAQLLPAA